MEDCPYFDQGFCKLGSVHCPMSHVQRELCPDYQLGFCPRGPNCHREHIKSLIKAEPMSLGKLANFPAECDWLDRSTIRSAKEDESSSKRLQQKTQARIRCHNCGVVGHKSTYCQEDACDPEELNRLLAEDKEYSAHNKGVMCFFCQLYGHYSNVCPERR